MASESISRIWMFLDDAQTHEVSMRSARSAERQMVRSELFLATVKERDMFGGDRDAAAAAAAAAKGENADDEVSVGIMMVRCA